MNLEVIFGPPGTGKTTELTRLVQEYAEREGGDSLLVAAYTRTAARELAGRDLPIPEDRVGTLHAHCFHALGEPPIAESFLQEWNTTYPVYALSTQKSLFTHDEPQYTWKRLGDECLQRINVARHQRLPQERWHPSTRVFWEKWQAWKQDNGYLDFTDLIEQALTMLPVAPGRPATLILDEAQDLSLLQWALITQWGRHATRVITAGDDEQCLYRWAGADVRPLLAASNRRTLPQSYRIPRHIHAIATRYSQRLRTHHPKNWYPRNDDGTVRHGHEPWDVPDGLMPRLVEWIEEPWGPSGETVACLAPCAYMLDPLITRLKARGIPFSNRWRRSHTAWNPLSPPVKGVSIVRQLLDFLRPANRVWTWQELGTWLLLLEPEGILHPQAKRLVAMHGHDTALCTMEDLARLFVPEALSGALSGGIPWLKRHALQRMATALAYPVRVYQHYGERALIDEPQVTVGTVHSLKGAEADTVVFFQDLSRTQQLALCEGGKSADDIYRMLYVAVTRARQRLYFAGMPCV